MTLISRCGSRFLMNMCSELYDQNVRYRMVASTEAYPERNVRSEHDRIAEAALARDADLAVQRLIEHYRSTGGFLRKRFEHLAVATA